MSGTEKALTSDDMVDIGEEHHKAGRLQEAESYYLKALEIDPGHPGALFYLANMAYDDGRLPLATQLTEELLHDEPNDAEAWHLLGMIAFKEERFSRAVECLNKALVIQPAYMQAYFSLGDVLSKQGELDAALAIFNKTLSLKPDYAEAYCNRGNALLGLKRPDEALASYDQALSLKPDHTEAYINRGNALLYLTRLDEALSSYNQALSLKPDYAEAYYNRGNALLGLKRLDEAIASYNQAVSLKPEHFEAYINRGNALKELERLDDALANYDQALSLKPDCAVAHTNRGNTLKDLKRLDEALASYNQALLLKPDYAEAYYHRGNTLKELEETDAARDDFERALQLKPDYCQARWSLGFIDISPIYRSSDEVEISRQLFGQALHNLDKWFDSSRLNGAEEAVAAPQPFYLAYQEKNNKDLLSCYGRLARRLMEHWQKANVINPQNLADSGKIKVGVVSSHIREHSVWDAIVKGWLLNFDSSKFEWHVFNLSSMNDEQTELARSKVSSFVEKIGSFKEWATSIAENRIEVLIFPEIGMDLLTAKLATLRLAPLQIATWGHPETTGLETIDYYLSADLLEPDDADSNYTESLVKLPNLGCTYTPHHPIRSTLDLSKLGISDEAPLLLCPGTPFKYAPKHDGVFPRLARRLERCTFVFFDNAPRWTAMLKLRLRTAFEKENLVMEDYVKFIPWQGREDFFALMRRADVFMDTIGFSGFNTAIQAISCSLPVVAIDGRFMRGRLASGILKRLDLSELICDSETTYCDVIERLVKNKNFRIQVVSKINTRRDILYGDMEPLRALERFLLGKCRG